MNIEKYLDDRKTLINDKLEKLSAQKWSKRKHLIKTLQYSLLNGGKRIRPILALATCEIFGGSTEKAIMPALSLELIHTYSLIHDDLPCMDDDDYRRGKPSLHKVYTEAKALLTGDLFLTQAFEILANSRCLTDSIKITLIKTLTNAAGINGMIGGQFMDIESGENINCGRLRLIHQYKTGALIEASFLFGAIIASANEDERKIIASFARDIGLIFQIIDDILDVTQSFNKHGREESSDLKNKKSTYATILGAERAQKRAEHILQRALRNLSHLSTDASLLKELALYLLKRNI